MFPQKYTKLTEPTECYKMFLEKFMSLYDEYFPTKKKLKEKDIQSPRKNIV